MKKFNLLLLFAITFVPICRAQYFENNYQGFQMGSGLTTVVTDGHLMAGISDPDNDLIVVKTDIDGGFTLPLVTFNKSYHLVYQNNDVVVNDAEAIELINGTGVGVMGSFSVVVSGVTTHGLFYVKLNNVGTPLVTTCYIIDYEVRLKAMCEGRVTSIRTRDIYATGDLTRIYNGNRRTDHIFAIRITAAGALVWGNDMITQAGFIPSVSTPRPLWGHELHANDIIQSPYPDGYGNYPVIVVGGIENICSNPNSIDWNGLWIPIDEFIGGGLPYTICNGNDDNEEYNAIDISSEGFIVAGYNNGNTGYINSWITLMDNSNLPNVTWTYIYISPFNRGANLTELTDIKWKFNTNTNKSEYFAIGYDKDGSGNEYLIYLKVDDLGGLLGSTYYIQNSNAGLTPVSIGLNTAGTANGVGLYSYDVASSPLHWNLIKAYFNGVIDCDYYQYSPSDVDIPLDVIYDNGYWWPFNEGSISISDDDDLNYNQDCYAEMVAGGANITQSTSLHEQESKNEVFLLYPNPVNREDYLRIALKSNSESNASITIKDILGKEIYSKQVNQEDILLISSALFKAGIYQISVEIDDKTVHSKLIVK